MEKKTKKELIELGDIEKQVVKMETKGIEDPEEEE